MANRTTLTFQTKPETKERLDRLANLTQRSKSYLANQAVEKYLAAEEEFVASVQAGIASADAGKVVSGEALRRNLHAHVDQVASRKK